MRAISSVFYRYYNVKKRSGTDLSVAKVIPREKPFNQIIKRF